ncbi:hypothetical protein ACSSS7_000300 [Eimeria intestinalis]
MGRSLTLMDIDFDLIEKCTEPKTLRRVLALLQQDGGYYVDLMKAAEDRLEQLTGRRSKGNHVSEADRQQVAADLLAWEQSMLLLQQEQQQQQQQQQQQGEETPELEVIEEQMAVTQATDRIASEKIAPPRRSHSNSSKDSSSSSKDSSSKDSSSKDSSSGEKSAQEAGAENERDTGSGCPVAAATAADAAAGDHTSSTPHCSNNTAAAAAAAAADSSSNAVRIPIAVLEDSGDESEG